MQFFKLAMKLEKLAKTGTNNDVPINLRNTGTNVTQTPWANNYSKISGILGSPVPQPNHYGNSVLSNAADNYTRNGLTSFNEIADSHAERNNILAAQGRSNEDIRIAPKKINHDPEYGKNQPPLRFPTNAGDGNPASSLAKYKTLNEAVTARKGMQRGTADWNNAQNQINAFYGSNVRRDADGKKVGTDNTFAANADQKQVVNVNKNNPATKQQSSKQPVQANPNVNGPGSREFQMKTLNDLSMNIKNSIQQMQGAGKTNNTSKPNPASANTTNTTNTTNTANTQWSAVKEAVAGKYNRSLGNANNVGTGKYTNLNPNEFSKWPADQQKIVNGIMQNSNAAGNQNYVNYAVNNYGKQSNNIPNPASVNVSSKTNTPVGKS